MPQRAYIGVGSNQGSKEENCRHAVREIGRMPQTRVREVSTWFVTEPWGAASTEWYVNGVVAVDTDLEPESSPEALSGPRKADGTPAQPTPLGRPGH